jgi:hypothetical protein
VNEIIVEFYCFARQFGFHQFAPFGIIPSCPALKGAEYQEMKTGAGFRW